MKQICPANQKEWRAWLAENHTKEDSVWVVIHKTKSLNPTMYASQAVEEALCFGWIDSVKKTIDEEKYLQFFSKRRPTSHWSRLNKNKVEALLKAGLMTEAGIKSVQLAKENGSWKLLNNLETMIIPKELDKEFAKKPGSKFFFISLSRSVQKAMLQSIFLADTEKIKTERIFKIVENCDKRINPLRQKKSLKNKNR